MSLIQSAKLNGHEPYTYLKDVLIQLPTHMNNAIEELLPHNWNPVTVGVVMAWQSGTVRSAFNQRGPCWNSGKHHINQAYSNAHKSGRYLRRFAYNCRNCDFR